MRSECIYTCYSNSVQKWNRNYDFQLLVFVLVNVSYRWWKFKFIILKNFSDTWSKKTLWAFYGPIRSCVIWPIPMVWSIPVSTDQSKSSLLSWYQAHSPSSKLHDSPDIQKSWFSSKSYAFYLRNSADGYLLVQMENSHRGSWWSERSSLWSMHKAEVWQHGLQMPADQKR